MGARRPNTSEPTPEPALGEDRAQTGKGGVGAGVAEERQRGAGRCRRVGALWGRVSGGAGEGAEEVPRVWEGGVCVREEALSRARSAAGRLCSAREELTRLTR